MRTQLGDPPARFGELLLYRGVHGGVLSLSKRSGELASLPGRGGRLKSAQSMLWPCRAKLSVNSAELLDEGRVYLYFATLHIDPLRLIPPLLHGQHLSSIEAVSLASL